MREKRRKRSERYVLMLTQAGFTILTGGGPGAMEAANLGARLAGQFAVLSEAIAQLGTTPDYAGAETLWVAAALQVLAQTRSMTVLPISVWSRISFSSISLVEMNSSP